MSAISLVFPGLNIDPSELLLFQPHCLWLFLLLLSEDQGASKRYPSFEWMNFHFHTNWKSLFFSAFVGFLFLNPECYTLQSWLFFINLFKTAVPLCPVFLAVMCWWLCNICGSLQQYIFSVGSVCLTRFTSALWGLKVDRIFCEGVHEGFSWSWLGG